MKRFILPAILVLGVACGSGEAPEPEAGASGDITATEVLDRADELVILDVRTPQEFAAGHVPGAINISHDQLAERISEVEQHKGREIVVYCKSGKRAGMAREVLAANGFQNVMHLQGDMTGWHEAGHPVETPTDPATEKLQTSAAAIFGVLPEVVPNPKNPESDEKIALGRMLFYETRVSKNHDISCNSCHDLANFGQDNQPTSPGHGGQRGERSSPSVYNAALHIAQFWDGREPDVEAQAKGPVLNPVEMAMSSSEDVLVVLKSIPGYVEAFAAAFPDEEDPITYDNFGLAVGAFERRLMTPGPFDAFMAGDASALTAEQIAGLQTFMSTGCISCHSGPAVGGGMYRRLGLIKPYPTEDEGRFLVTGNETDRYVFKVPSLRNVARTAPYFHDGHVETLEQAIRIMAEHQLDKQLDDAQVASIAAFLESLTGDVDEAYVEMPELPESGPDTPAPDPS